MIKIIFDCLNKLNENLECEYIDCIFNTQGNNPKCEYFKDLEECHLYIPEYEYDNKFTASETF